MYKVIMVPTHGSETERAALSVAVRLARRLGASRVALSQLVAYNLHFLAKI